MYYVNTARLIGCLVRRNEYRIKTQEKIQQSLDQGGTRAKQTLAGASVGREKTATSQRGVERIVQQMPAMTPVLPEPQTWRELLATLISDPKERARVVKVTGITEVTLKRWAKWKTKPRPYQLRPLLLAFPYYRDLFIRLIQKEFPTFSPSERPEFASPVDTDLEDETSQIPPDLYEHVIAARFTDAPGNLFWTV